LPNSRVYLADLERTLRITMQSISISQPRGATGVNPLVRNILSNLL
jgi:hypothetical protein